MYCSWLIPACESQLLTFRGIAGPLVVNHVGSLESAAVGVLIPCYKSGPPGSWFSACTSTLLTPLSPSVVLHVASLGPAPLPTLLLSNTQRVGAATRKVQVLVLKPKLQSHRLLSVPSSCSPKMFSLCTLADTLSSIQDIPLTILKIPSRE